MRLKPHGGSNQEAWNWFDQGMYAVNIPGEWPLARKYFNNCVAAIKDENVSSAIPNSCYIIQQIASWLHNDLVFEGEYAEGRLLSIFLASYIRSTQEDRYYPSKLEKLAEKTDEMLKIKPFDDEGRHNPVDEEFQIAAHELLIELQNFYDKP